MQMRYLIHDLVLNTTVLQKNKTSLISLSRDEKAP